MATTQKGTYYPSDYSKIADVPADMKKMAESIDKQTDNLVQKEEGKGLSSNDFTNELKAKLNNLENYDDTEVKQDISNLDTNKASKAELQEATIALQAELKATRKDLECGTLEGQAEGESLYLQDSSNARFREFGIGGNREQEKREGYNKFDIQKWLDNDLNVAHGTVNSKSKDKISLTASEAGDCFTDTYAMSSNVSDNQQCINKFGIEVKPNTAYTIYLDKNNTEKDSLYVFFCDAEYNYISLKNKMSADNYNILNFTIPEDAKYLTFRLGVFVADKTIEFSNIMILEGTYTKETLPKYEQYGAMPSLEFPSEIKAVKDSANVTVCNKNKLDFSKWNNITASHGTIEQVKNGIKLTATTNDCYTDTFAYKFQRTLNKDKIEHYGLIAKSNTKYTFSCKVNDTTKSKRIAMFFSDKDYNAISYVTSATSVLTATTPENCKYITVRISVVNTGDSLTFTDLQVEEGETATDYVEHEEQTFTMPVQQSFKKVGDYADTFIKQGGKWYEKHLIKRLIFNGTESWTKSRVNTNVSYWLSNNDARYDTISQQDGNNIPKIKSNYFKEISFNGIFTNTEAITINYLNSNLDRELRLGFGLDTNITTVELLKNWLATKYNEGVPVYADYVLETPQLIECTAAQIQVLGEIEKTLHTYKNGTHVYCTDEVSPIFNVKYTRDLETMIERGEIAGIEVISNLEIDEIMNN